MDNEAFEKAWNATDVEGFSKKATAKLMWDAAIAHGREKMECGHLMANLTPAKCNEKPEELIGQPIGQYHCPDCGEMVLAGFPHPEVCLTCEAIAQAHILSLLEGVK